MISSAGAWYARSSEISPGEVSGGTNTSHTIGVQALAALLAAVSSGAPHIDYRQAALEGNVLSKKTDGARRRTFRYLKELYLLRPDSILFRALRDLWVDDSSAQSHSCLRVGEGHAVRQLRMGALLFVRFSFANGGSENWSMTFPSASVTVPMKDGNAVGWKTRLPLTL
ncbi:MAG: hypothetical protein H0V58_02565 [Actinobacteria bacterium]|nr:hypothetical protein [Actinomycetota bacterium]